MTITAKSFSFFEVLNFVANYWVQQPWKLATIIGLLASASFVEAYLPSALSSFLGAIRQQQNETSICFYLAIFLGAYFVQALLFSSTCFIYNFFETHIFKTLMDDTFAHIYRLPENFFVNTFTGSIISKVSRARQKIEIFEDQVIFRIFPTFLILISSTVFLAWHFPALALCIVIYFGLLLAVSAILVFKISGPAQGKYAEMQDIFGAHLADSIGGMATTKAYAQEKHEFLRFTDITHLLRVKNLRAYLLSNMATFIQRLLLLGMLSILLGGGTWYLFQGKASLENMAYLVLAYSIMASYIRELGENIKNLLTSAYDLHGVIALLHEPLEVPSYTKTAALAIRQGAIVFDNVKFSYPQKPTPIFNHFSIFIKAGERVALVGHSGSGKTSFIRLLQGLYPIQEGSILIDEQDISQVSHSSLRNAISLVPQDPILFHRTLRENIAYGKPTATLKEIHAAAEQAHIAHFITSLPQQYETLVGERGIKLSGGERQRIAIARAILADRPILILDEATSSLDSASERAIQNALYKLTHGRTSIMIAHRLSTILDADRILVFEAGKIVEAGKHEELILKKEGVYARFFKLQSVDIGR